MTRKPIVVIESPYAGDVPRNTRYLRAAVRDSLLRGEAPFASHALYTLPGVLDDDDPHERKLGIEAGFAFRKKADYTAAYIDLGFSDAMLAGIQHAKRFGQVVAHRRVEGWE